jgi:uncharacterized protein YbjQ (UPF0145 family)
MGFLDWFRGAPPTDPDTAERDAARRAQTVQNLQRGGLPVNAMERLREARARQGTDKHFFTSNLSVNEFVLTHDMGVAPLGQVMGSCVYHVGYQWNRATWSNASLWGGGSSYELKTLTEAYHHARVLTFGRLDQEAALLGATGVLGVRFTRKEHEWGSDLLEFSAFGTAIREPDRPAAAASPSEDAGRLFLSDLSGEEFWKLRQAGFRPVGVAAGNCTYYQIPTWQTQAATGGGGFFFGTTWQSQELQDYTQALYQARELGMGRLSHEARALGGVGLVGVDMHLDAEPVEVELSNDRHRTDMMYHFTAMGTVIAPAPAPAAPTAIPSWISVPLRDPQPANEISL